MIGILLLVIMSLLAIQIIMYKPVPLIIIPCILFQYVLAVNYQYHIKEQKLLRKARWYLTSRCSKLILCFLCVHYLRRCQIKLCKGYFLHYCGTLNCIFAVYFVTLVFTNLDYSNSDQLITQESTTAGLIIFSLLIFFI